MALMKNQSPTPRPMSVPRAATAAAALALVAVTGCVAAPREAAVQYVARDAWDSTCAGQAIVEQWSQQGGDWKVKGEVYQVQVAATFKLVNKCTGKDGREYAQFETVRFESTVELSPCKKSGTKGWSLPGKQETRCWTGPTPLP
jgi:hypothetical protein